MSRPVSRCSADSELEGSGYDTPAQQCKDSTVDNLYGSKVSFELRAASLSGCSRKFEP